MTKRFASLLALAVCLAFSTAHAEWKMDELRWVKTNASHSSATIGVPIDTTWTTLAKKTLLDTTGTFQASMLAPRLGLRQMGTGTSIDSLVAGFVCIQSDSNVTAPNTLEGLLISIDGRVGGYGYSIGNAWVAVDTISVPATAVLQAAGTIVLPVRGIGLLGGPLSGFPELRIRATSPSVGKLPAARIFWRYWKE